MPGWHVLAADYDALDRAVANLVQSAEASAPAESPREAPRSAPLAPVAPVEPPRQTAPPAVTGQEILFQDFWGVEMSEGAFDLHFFHENGQVDRGKVSIFQRGYKPGTKEVRLHAEDVVDWSKRSSGEIVIAGKNGPVTYQLDTDKRVLLLKSSAPDDFPSANLSNRQVDVKGQPENGGRELQK